MLGLEPFSFKVDPFAKVPIPSFATTGDIANALGCSARSVGIATDNAGVRPTFTVGNVNAYDRYGQLDILREIRNDRHRTRPGPKSYVNYARVLELVAALEKGLDAYEESMRKATEILKAAGMVTMGEDGEPVEPPAPAPAEPAAAPPAPTG